MSATGFRVTSGLSQPAQPGHKETARFPCGPELVARGISEELRRRLPGQRKTQRKALLVAIMLDAGSANLMEVAAALPRSTVVMEPAPAVRAETRPHSG